MLNEHLLLNDLLLVYAPRADLILNHLIKLASTILEQQNSVCFSSSIIYHLLWVTQASRGISVMIIEVFGDSDLWMHVFRFRATSLPTSSGMALPLSSLWGLITTAIVYINNLRSAGVVN